MLPVVVTYGNLTAANGSSLGTSSAATVNPILLYTTVVNNLYQQRVTVTSAGNDSSIYFHIVGLNQAGFTVSEFAAGTNATSTISNLDYWRIISVRGSSSSTSLVPVAPAGAMTVGVNGTGSSLWNITNWHVTPTNIEYGCVLQSFNATFSIQYTYDDPNNLPAGVTYPQPFNHPTIINATASIDGPSNDPITAWRLYISGGTGTIRATGIQAGIGSP